LNSSGIIEILLSTQYLFSLSLGNTAIEGYKDYREYILLKSKEISSIIQFIKESITNQLHRLIIKVSIR